MTKSLSFRTAPEYLKSIFCVYDIKQFPGHDAAINQIYGYQNGIHDPPYQINALRIQRHNAISIELLNST